MATVVRAEAVITAQNRLRPGLTSAVRDLEKFKRAAAAATRQQQMMERASTALRAAGGLFFAGNVAGQVAAATKRYADLDRQMTRIGITGDASQEEIAAGLKSMRDLAQEVAAPVDQIKAGMDALTSSGLSFREALAMLPSVAKTAQASGAGFDDIANSSLAAVRHLKIQIKDLQLAQDMMAFGGQMGQFELKDMARYLPSLAPAAKAVGFEGTKGLARMVAMLQVVREGAGTSEEAATNFANILQKMESEETVNKFEKMGVDLRKEMDRARKSGDDLFETFVKASQVALKGDMSKLPQLFADAQMQKGMRALLDGYGKIPDMVSKLGGAAGTVQGNLKRITGDTQAAIDRLGEGADRAKTALGSLAAIVAGPAMEAGASNLTRLAEAMERAAKAAKEQGVVAAARQMADDLKTAVVADQKQAGDDFAAAEDDYKLQTLAAENKSGSDAGDITLNYLRSQPPSPQRDREIRDYEASRARHQTGRAMTGDEGSALARQQMRLLGPSAPQFDQNDPAIEAIRKARRAAAFRPDTRPSGPLVAAPQPPQQRDNGAIRDVAPLDPAPYQAVTAALDAAAGKAGDVREAVTQLGPAGQQAGSQMADGVGQTLAALQRVSSLLDSIADKARNMPSVNLRVNSSGLNTGRVLPEVQ
jgi:TP901 family phage tail tape measure protein